MIIKNLLGDVVVETGRTARVRLRPGVGVQGPNGEHLGGGEVHLLPAWLAYELVQTQRADPVLDAPAPTAPGAIEHADPVAAHRDPQPKKRGR